MLGQHSRLGRNCACRLQTDCRPRAYLSLQRCRTVMSTEAPRLCSLHSSNRTHRCPNPFEHSLTRLLLQTNMPKAAAGRKSKKSDAGGKKKKGMMPGAHGPR